MPYTGTTFFEMFVDSNGGPGKVVEIDKSKFGKRKYHPGRSVDGHWAFGGEATGTHS